MNAVLTHWHGCWRIPGHHSCAKEKVAQLYLALEEILEAVTSRDIGWEDIVKITAKEALEGKDGHTT